MKITYRKAVPDDTPDCITLRGLTRENAFSVAELAERGITLESWHAAIADGSLPGHVATEDGKMVGYCFGHGDTGEIAVLALLPSHEGKGIGRTLLALMVEDLRQLGPREREPDEQVRRVGHHRAGARRRPELGEQDLLASRFGKQQGPVVGDPGAQDVAGARQCALERPPDVDLAAGGDVGDPGALAERPAFSALVPVVRDELPPRLPVRHGAQVGVGTGER